MAAAAMPSVAVAAAPAGSAAPTVPAPPAPGASLECLPKVAEFEAYQDDTVIARFTCTNRGTRAQTIVKVEPRGAAARATGAPRTLAPGESGELQVYQPLATNLGKATFRVGVTTDDPAQPIIRLGLSGFVQSAYEPERGRLDLGWVDPAVGDEATFDLFSREVERLEVTAITGLPPFVSVAVSGRAGEVGEGVRLVARLLPGAPLGSFSAAGEVATNVPHQPRYLLTLAANVFGDVVPSVNPLHLGLVRSGQPAQGVVELRSRSGRAVVVEEARLSGSAALQVTVAACPGRGSDCARLVVAGAPVGDGSLAGDLDVRLKGGETLPLRWGLWIVSPGTEVKTLDILDPAAAILPPGDGEPR